MSSGSDEIKQRMRSDWDARAAQNAYHYVASDREEWTREEFLESGRLSVNSLVIDDLPRICGDRNPKDLRALEIGCGAGRMTGHLAEIFAEVHAVDVSPLMLERAKENVGDRPNVRLYLCDGASLPDFEDRSFDFILSYIVFQHIPDREIIQNYIRAAARALREGGVFKFQVQGNEGESGDGADTWLGASLSPEDVVRLANESGCHIVDFTGLGEQYFWLWFRKSSEPRTEDRSSDLLSAELERRRAVLNDLKSQLMARTNWAQSLDERVRELDGLVAGLQDELKTSNSWAQTSEIENQRLREESAERTAWAQDREKHAGELAEEIKRQQAELVERAQWAHNLELELESRTEWARGLERDLELLQRWTTSIRQSFLYRAAVRLRLMPAFAPERSIE